jgi:hypothetical protein
LHAALAAGISSFLAILQVYPRKGTKRKHDEEEQDEGAEVGLLWACFRVALYQNESWQMAPSCPPTHLPVQLLSAKLSGRILKAAREQQAEVDADEAEEAFEQLAGAPQA